MESNLFVPLTSAASSNGAAQEFRVLVARNPERAEAFRPQTVGESPAGGAVPASSCQSRVWLERDGERVTAIHVQCSCGQVTDLACVY
jgi:hypothetical protein